MDEFQTLLMDLAEQRRRAKSPGEPVEPSEEPATNYEKFLDTILTGNHPDFSDVIWDGETCRVQFTVPLRRRDGEAVEAIRQRAWRYFRRYGLSEQKLMSFRVVIKDGSPSHAIVSVRPEASGVLRLETSRLRQLQSS